MAQTIIPNLWFNGNAREAVDFYVSVFKDARILSVEYYTNVGEEITGHREGDIVTIEFELLDTRFVAINAGPEFSLSPAVSFMVPCKTQEELDYYWGRLSAVPEAEQCGWLVDCNGLSWQIVPEILDRLLKQGTEEQRRRLTAAYMEMKKFDIAELEKAFAG